MGHEQKKLSAVAVRNKSTPGLFADGGGLYLQVTKSGAKTWIYRFMMEGRRRDMGLGPVHTVSLAEARDEALNCRQLVRQGIDPIEKRKTERLSAKAEAVKTITFKECAENYIKAHEPSWKNAKHIAQWTSTLTTYVYPTFGALPVAEIDTGLIMKVIEPIWATKTETASRIRGRMEAILDWASVRKYRSGENPARWKGHLDHLLPSKSKLQKKKHHSALPYDQISDFISTLRKQNGTSARALEFTILTAARTSEVIEAVWSEIDFENKVWTIPAERMKAGREHRVPLSETALNILQKMAEIQTSDFVFPGNSKNRPLSNMAMLTVLRRMKRTDITVHGFRSTFRDWVAEKTGFAKEVAEMSLAHAVENKVEAAYRRGDLFEKRRTLMNQWEQQCTKFG
ncbi:MAG: integrase arm-type DNA-binding domain-containing protein [Methylocystaceae bacterium]|nr:integrase arm-type DNA-binding domain-containing protein [Methylocystaceae bacterium]